MTKAMNENKTMDNIHRGLLKKFHTLCSVLGMSADEKRLIVESYGVESSRDIDTHALVDLCATLSAKAENNRQGDRLRKRLMGAIGEWLRKTGKESSPQLIKGIACHASGYKSFNSIPPQRLRSLTEAFRNKIKDIDSVEILTSEMRAIIENLGIKNIKHE